MNTTSTTTTNETTTPKRKRRQAVTRAERFARAKEEWERVMGEPSTATLPALPAPDDEGAEALEKMVSELLGRDVERKSDDSIEVLGVLYDDHGDASYDLATVRRAIKTAERMGPGTRLVASCEASLHAVRVDVEQIQCGHSGEPIPVSTLLKLMVEDAEADQGTAHALDLVLYAAREVVTELAKGGTTNAALAGRILSLHNMVHELEMARSRVELAKLDA
jgi:hypothetical protein